MPLAGTFYIAGNMNEFSYMYNVIKAVGKTLKEYREELTKQCGTHKTTAFPEMCIVGNLKNK